MTAYTQNTHIGPPKGGKYVKGDTVVDAASTKWVCLRDGQPGIWDVYVNTVAEDAAATAAAVSPLIAAPSDTALPTPTAAYRGKFFVVTNAGVGADTVHVCIDGDGFGTYAWKTLTIT